MLAAPVVGQVKTEPDSVALHETTVICGGMTKSSEVWLTF